MISPKQNKKTINTSAGEFPLDECHLKLAGREWKILHVGAVLSKDEESHFLRELREIIPYGITLWASAIALANEIASREDDFRNRRVLELGAGTGLPGIVAASLQAKVSQTDRFELVMSVCRRNAENNGVQAIEQRLMDWTNWNHDELYDWIIGSDILYGEDMHFHLRRIFETNLAPSGRILISDPFRKTSLNLLEKMEADGWTITMSKWSIGEESSLRQIGVFELTPPN